MLTKLAKAFSLLRQEVTALKGDVQRIEKVRQVVQHGKDGVSPDPDEIVSAVLEKIPAPKDGVSPDPQAIAEAAAKLIPEPKPGRDAVPPSVRDVADVVLAKIEKPKDGVSPDPKAIAEAAAKLLPVPKDGVSPTAEEVAKKMPNPQRGKTGAPGKNGVSVTDVQLNNNELFVFLDGKKKKAGTIKVPAASAPFNPGNAGGGGSARGAVQETIGYTPQGTFLSGDLQVGALDTPQTVTFGAGGTTANGGATVGADGVITVIKPLFWSIKQRFRAGRTGASGVSELFFWAEISTDDGATWNVLGSAVDVPLNSSSDTVVFFDLSNIQVPAGAKLRNRFARSSTGNDSGDLRVGVPSAALQALNVPDAPSAQITFYAINQ